MRAQQEGVCIFFSFPKLAASSSIHCAIAWHRGRLPPRLPDLFQVIPNASLTLLVSAISGYSAYSMRKARAKNNSRDGVTKIAFYQ
jgi:hypothetical protein